MDLYVRSWNTKILEELEQAATYLGPLNVH